MLIKIASGLTAHAEHELKLIGMGPDAKDEMNREMGKDILDIVKRFGEQGHSGFSASYAISILQKLLKYKPLSPLTGKPDEWTEVSPGLFQNKRVFSVFKDKKHTYDLDGYIFTDNKGMTYTSRGSQIDIKFPYTPKPPVVLNYRDSLKRKREYK